MRMFPSNICSAVVLCLYVFPFCPLGNVWAIALHDEYMIMNVNSSCKFRGNVYTVFYGCDNVWTNKAQSLVNLMCRVMGITLCLATGNKPGAGQN